MNKLIIPMLAALILSGCGTLHKHTKRSEVEKTTIATSSSSTKTVTREKADTVIHVKSDTAMATIPLDAITEGKTLTITDGPIDFTITSDPEAGHVTITAIAAAHDIPVMIDKETVTETEAETVISERSEAVLEETRKDREPVSWMSSASLFLFALSLIILILLLLWRSTTRR